jgi:RNA polymerase sigma-70 factor (ECF subfamily)
VFATVTAMAKPDDPDAALMLRAKRGDQAAFEELVIKYQQPVMNFIYRTVPDVEEAEDLAQNVFVQAWKARQRYKVSAKFSTWLFTIARNLSLNEIRRRSRHSAESMDAPAGDEESENTRQFEDHSTSPPTAEVARAELEQKVAEAVSDLPENQRTAMLLAQDHETTYEDIAQVLDCSLSATKSIIFRARETLKQRLKPYLKSGEWVNKP